ncbi:MAG TPA: hypothetical protein VJY83_08435 [Thiopseudomonas sp.]|nr:hypothetical protein [Thiopseudomonas sp.]
MNSPCRFYAAEKVQSLFNQKHPAAALKRADHKTLLHNISSQPHRYHARLKGLEAVIVRLPAVCITMFDLYPISLIKNQDQNSLTIASAA